jgi:hypothetical protein
MKFAIWLLRKYTMPAIKPIARIIEMAIERIFVTLLNSKKFTTGKSKTARRQAKANGIRIFWETFIKKQIKKITRNLNPSFT